MMINRYNYEEYFLLYVDKELGVEERKAVEAFIAGHPDLAEELQSLQQSVVKPEKHLVFTNKEALMKSTLAAGLINESNYEEYFILYADDELSTPQKIAVEEYVYAHPERQHEFELFQQAKLEPEKVECDFKNALYKKPQKRKLIPFRWSVAAAAAAILFIAGWFWLNQDPDASDKRFAKDNKPATRTEIKTAQPEEARSNQQPNITVNPEKKNDHPTDEATAEKATGITKAASSNNERPALAVTKKQREPVNEIRPGQRVAPMERDLTPAVKTLQTEVDIPGTVDVAKTKVKAPVKDLPVVMAAVQNNKEEEEEEEENIISFASENRSENVFLTNIPVDNNVPLRSFLRKASRVINKVTALKHSNRAGISIGSVEIAIQ